MWLSSSFSPRSFLVHVTLQPLTRVTTLQICQFCFHNIKTNMNGTCPACRRPYDEKSIQYKAVTAEEFVLLSRSPHYQCLLTVP